jgi:hypothetical protein
LNRIEALEMWIWRRMKRISWTEKKTNEEVLRRVGEKRTMLETIVWRKKNWIGHIMRGDGLMKEVMEGKMEGKRGPGRKRIGMIDDLLEKVPYGESAGLESLATRDLPDSRTLKISNKIASSRN